MTRRILGPVGGPIVFFLIAGLVFVGLGWVTVASLRVEEAQRESAARAEHEANLRVALWRLDGRVLPVLVVEDSRPFHHYAGGDVPTAYGPASAPLLEPDLPPWMRLHFQIDPQQGWSSPQVMESADADRLRGSWPGLSLRNVTSERAALLADLRSRHPVPHVTQTFAARERAIPAGSGPLVYWHIPTPVGQPLDQLQPVNPPAGGPPNGPPTGPTTPANPATNTLGRYTVSPEYKAPLEKFESGAKQVGQGKELAPAPQPAGGTSNGVIANNTAAGRSQDANPVSESQSRGIILQKASSDARSASGYQYPQTMPTKPGGGGPVPQNTLGANGGLGGGGFGGAPQTSPPGAGLAQTFPPGPPGALTVPAGMPVPGGPPAGPFSGGAAARPANDLAGKAGGPGGVPGGGPTGRVAATPVREEEKSFFFGFGGRRAGLDAENAKAGPQGEMKKVEDTGRPNVTPGAMKLSDGVLRSEGAVGKKLAEQPAAGGLFKDFGTALRFRERELFRREVDRAGTGPESLAGRYVEPVPAPVTPFDAPMTGDRPVVHIGSIHPQWLAGPDGADVLVLVRTAHIDDQQTVYQGVVLDWPQLEAVLLESVKDLFPDARLVPVMDPAAVSPERAMSALPVQLDPGTTPTPPPAGWTPLRFGLVLAWVAALIAFAAVGLSGWSLIDLAERRIRFVSAVTHELRTPLTSLRLYLDLLLSGMVQDEGKRKEYLATLNTESDRLHRLIDNVLDFARLEGRRKASDAQPVLVAELLEQVRQTWADRCAADDKELVAICTLPPDEKLTTDANLVQQIVGNLIDNSRKYSRDAADKRIWVWVKPGTGRRRVVIEVEDRGAGVANRERAAIFRPFRRGGTADTKAGGAGLGLALAKQWAELLGGRLSYRPADGGIGACFRLELRT
jgi:signal transduction histidine kinase